MTALLVLGTLGVIVLTVTAFSITPHARARRAVLRRRRRELAEIRTRLSVSPRATYEKQFPKGRKRSGASSSSGHDGAVALGSGWNFGGSGCDFGSGGGDSGGGGGDGGC